MAVEAHELTKDYKFGFHDIDISVFRTEKGLSPEVVAAISAHKNEPEWMLKFRLKALSHFRKRSMPSWGADLSGIDFDNIYYYVKPTEEQSRSWDDVPDSIRQTFDKLGIPEAERKFLAGVSAQYDSEVVYHSIRADLDKLGVLFGDCDTGLRDHPEIFRKYFGTVIPANDNKFAALNSAVWSGGSFVYVPRGVRVDVPLQAYFRINSDNMGQFERTLIIAEEGSYVHYIEGCTAPTYSSDLLHSAVVEIIAHKDAHVRYTTIQNWSNNVYNLVTKRAVAYEGARVEWIDGNLGSKVTMKYPAIYLMGEHAHGEVLSAAFAGEGQHQDAGSKCVHVASNTTSNVVSRSISKDGGRTSYRGHIKVHEKATGVRSSVRCDALLLDEDSQSDTYPYMDIDSPDVTIGHEATVSKIGDEQIFYLMSRGLSEGDATALIVNGFFEPFVKELPMEYALELNRLLAVQMEGSVDYQAPPRTPPRPEALDGLMATQLQSPGAIGPEAVTTRIRSGCAWLGERRRGAWDAYSALPMPDRNRDEDWRRTDVSGLHPDEFVADPGDTGRGASLVDAMRAMRDQIAPGAAFVATTRNGVQACEGTGPLTAQGIVVGSLEEAAATDEAAVRRALAHVPVDGSKFTALWNALWRGGCFVHVPAGVEARIPVVAAHSAAGERAAVFPATVVVLEANASLTLVELQGSPAGPETMLSDAVSVLHLGEGSRLDYCLLQRWSAATWHLATHRGVLARDARLRFFAATFGSRLQKAYWEALLEGPGADATLTGVCFGGGDQHLDHQSLQAHMAPSTHSDLLLKVAVRDRAQSVYGGLISVDRVAQKTDGYVQNRNLMLSRGAKASGIPMLEIKANDVRCSHGVTAGHIDDDQRFYAWSRGIGPEAADRMIVRGFMQDALDRCPHEGFAEFVGGVLDEVVDGHSAAGVEAEAQP